MHDTPTNPHLFWHLPDEQSLCIWVCTMKFFFKGPKYELANLGREMRKMRTEGGINIYVQAEPTRPLLNTPHIYIHERIHTHMHLYTIHTCSSKITSLVHTQMPLITKQIITTCSCMHHTSDTCLIVTVDYHVNLIFYHTTTSDSDTVQVITGGGHSCNDHVSSTCMCK